MHGSPRNDNEPDDLNVAAHHRCYTSRRHCYRLPPRAKQQSLPRSCDSGVPRRTIADFAPRNPKPPIREPNAPEKHEKKDEKEKDKKVRKPVIRTDGSVDGSENRTTMDDNPAGDPDAMFRYKWGVKRAEASDNDNLAEKGRRFTKRLWGVKRPQPDAESPGGGASERRSASPIIEGDEADETRMSGVSSARESKTTADYLSTPSSDSISPNDDLVAAEGETADASPPMNSEALRKLMRTSPGALEEVIAIDEEYNVPEAASPDAEIAAWESLVAKWRATTLSENQEFDYVKSLKTVSIPPEAPQPKLDVRAVRSVEDDTKDEGIDRSVKSAEIKRPGFMGAQKSDSYSSNRKMHTLHRNANCLIAQRYIELLPVSSTSVEKSGMKCPGSTSAFSTSFAGSMQKSTINETSNQQSEKRTDSKSHEKKSDATANSSNAAGPLLSEKSQTLPKSNSQKQSYADSKRLDEMRAVTEDEEANISLNQSQVTERSKAREKTVNDFPDKAKDREDSRVHASSQGGSAPSIDNRPVKSYAEESRSDAKRERNTLDPNAEDAGDLSEDYTVDGDYVRLPGDPYPYSKEHFDKWRVPHSRGPVYKSIRRETSRSDSSSVARSSPRNVNDSHANGAAAVPRDSHAGTVMETSGSGDSAKNAERASGFHMSSRDQRVAPDCPRVDDAADALGLQQWTDAFSRLGARTDSGRTGQAARDNGDNVSLHAYHRQ